MHNPHDFHFNEHPKLGAALTVSLALLSWVFDFHNMDLLLSIIAKLFQVGAAAMAIYVGYKTTQKKK